MNIETANRLLKLRKEKGLSQEELANQLGISRQAVSKWERAEASPDTDNLIELARLYNVTIDELLTTPAENNQAGAQTKHRPESEQPNTTPREDSQAASDDDNTWQQETRREENPAGEHPYEKKDHVSFKDGRIDIESQNGDRVHIGLDGIHVVDQNGERVDIGLHDGVHVSQGINAPDSIHWGKSKHDPAMHFPYPVLAFLAFILLGMAFNGWWWSWLAFLTIPLYYTAISAVRKQNLCIFCYPVLTAIIFFALGFTRGLWHPGWVIFTTIPLFYWLGSYLNLCRLRGK